MSANSSLWDSIATALSSSEWLVFLAHPVAANSPYVQKEVDWWLTRRASTPAAAAERVVLVLAGGDVVWDAQVGRFDPEASTALPPSLAAAFVKEPRWIDARWFTGDTSDPRWAEVVADVGATLRGVSKEDLVGQNVRLHRKAQMLARLAIVTLSVLLVLAVVFAGTAVVQRQRAEDNARISEARYLAIRSGQLLEDGNVNAARQLAAQSFLLDRSSSTEASLMASLLASGQVQPLTSLDPSATITTASVDGSIVYAGYANGKVVRLDIASGEVTTIGSLNTSVASLSASPDGVLVAAVGSGQGEDTVSAMWHATGETVTIPTTVPAAKIKVVDNGFALLTMPSSGSYKTRFLLDVVSETIQELPTSVSDDVVPIPARNQVLAIDHSGLRLMDLSTGRVLSEDAWAGGNKHAAVATADGSMVSIQGHLEYVYFFDTDPDNNLTSCPSGTPDGLCQLWLGWEGRASDFVARGPESGSSVAMARDGSSIAWVEGSILMVSPVVSVGEALNLGEPVAVRGMPDNAAVDFVGERILVRSADSIVLVDLDAQSPIRQSFDTNWWTGCAACEMNGLALSPNGRYLAFTPDSGSYGLAVLDLDTGEMLELSRQGVHPVAWPNNQTLIAADFNWEHSLLRVEVSDELLVTQEAANPTVSGTGMGGIVEDSGELGHIVTEDGRILSFATEDLAVVNEMRIAPTSAPSDDLHVSHAAVFTPDGTRAIVRNYSVYYLVDLQSGTGLPFPAGEQPVGFAPDGLVAVVEGSLVRYDMALTPLSSVTLAASGLGQAAQLSQSVQWLLVTSSNESAVNVVSLSDGMTIGSVSLGARKDPVTRLLWDSSDNALIVNKYGIDGGGIEVIRVALDPDSWVDAVCTAPDHTVLTNRDWLTLTGMPAPNPGPCG